MEHYQVTYNSNDSGGFFTIHIPKDKLEFISHPQRLHSLDLWNTQYAGILLGMTIKEQYDGYIEP